MDDKILQSYIEFPSWEKRNEIVKRTLQRDKDEVYKKRYTLFSTSCLIDDDYNKVHGTVTDHIKLQVSSDNLQFLYDFWNKNEITQKFDTSMWHYIFDNQEDRLVDTLSICW